MFGQNVVQFQTPQNPIINNSNGSFFPQTNNGFSFGVP